MNLEIISSEGIVFQGEVTKVTFPGELGSFTVLETVDIDGGFVDVNNNRIAVCLR